MFERTPPILPMKKCNAAMLPLCGVTSGQATGKKARFVVMIRSVVVQREGVRPKHAA
jgi:hypothetical protein